MMNARIADSNTLLTERIRELEAKVARLERSIWFGCLTRNGLDEVLQTLDVSGLALVYFDIDNLTLCNDRWGKPESSRRVAWALQMREADVTIGQWFSGDEFISLVPAVDAYGYTQRLLSRLKAQSMSATFVIVALDQGSDINALAQEADERIKYQKKALGRRGDILCAPCLLPS